MRNKILYKNFIIILSIDIFLLSFSWFFTHLLRFNFEIPESNFLMMKKSFIFIVVTKIFIFYFFDLYRGMWRYTSISDLLNIIKASFISTLLIVSCILFITRFQEFARSVFIIDWCLTMLLVSGYRLGIRLYLSVDRNNISYKIPIKRSRMFLKKINLEINNFLIIGAGDCGEKIYREIYGNPNLKLNVIGFLDDASDKIGKTIHGIPILGRTSDTKLIAEQFEVKEIIIAVPSATSQQMRAIVEHCKESRVSYKTVPGMGELINGNITINAVRDVAYRDLLGREAVKLDEDKIGAYVKGQSVLVTGAGGSIGSELCRQICRYNPQRIVLFERSESPLYEVELEFKKNFPHIIIVPLLGDIRDRRQLSNAFRVNQPNVVFHAAAYKHVPIMEIQPWKAVKNNILGTRNMIDISKQFMVERFVFVSTDKAVRPTNVMGASKRCSELLVQGKVRRNFSDTRFMTVRFGNVVGSIGSVVPLFKKQISAGGPVTVTHPDVMRYFMTIPEACQLILQAGAMGEGSEIFILDMGTPIKIIDIARDLIRLSGFEPDVDIKIKFIGLRPGEKLFEELITDGEGIVPTNHEKIMVLRGTPIDQEPLNGRIERLAKMAYEQDIVGIKTTLQEILPEYKPELPEDYHHKTANLIKIAKIK